MEWICELISVGVGCGPVASTFERDVMTSKKSQGSDVIPADMFWAVGETNVLRQTNLLRVILLEYGNCPSCWRCTLLRMFLSRFTNGCNNYGGISLLLSKLIQHYTVTINTVCWRKYCGSSVWIPLNETSPLLCHWQYLSMFTVTHNTLLCDRLLLCN